MPIELRDTEADFIQVFDDGTTLAQILKDLGWAEKERERSRIKGKRDYKTTGKPAGRPKGWKKGVDFLKNPPAEV